MRIEINQLLAKYINDTVIVNFLGVFILIILILILSIISEKIMKHIVLKAVSKFIRKSKNTWDDIFEKNGVFKHLSHIAPAIVVYIFSSEFGKFEQIIQKVSMSFIIFIGIKIIESSLDSIEDIYETFQVSKEKPIRGYIQLIKIFILIIGIILIISTFLNKSPWKLISGIGAMTALLMLVFKDTILGLVAGIQLAANNMISLGDWVEMPKYGADGDVIEITLTTVKIQNWDKTISTIPVYAFISGSFKNWKGMKESNGRRIKRNINIDINTIKFCDEQMINKLKTIEFINEYLNKKIKEINLHNKKVKNIENLVNGRHLTNIGTLRAYIYYYLENHPKISKEMTLLVRQKQPNEFGLPIEIYCFSNDKVWKNYESIQADIFDHIYSIIPEFGLKVYQNISGNDFSKINFKN